MLSGPLIGEFPFFFSTLHGDTRNLQWRFFNPKPANFLMATWLICRRTGTCRPTTFFAMNTGILFRYACEDDTNNEQAQGLYSNASRGIVDTNWRNRMLKIVNDSKVLFV